MWRSPYESDKCDTYADLPAILRSSALTQLPSAKRFFEIGRRRGTRLDPNVGRARYGPVIALLRRRHGSVIQGCRAFNQR